MGNRQNVIKERREFPLEIESVELLIKRKVYIYFRKWKRNKYLTYFVEYPV